MSELQKLAHAVWQCKYHLIWCPKYRFKILNGAVQRSVGDLLRLAAASHARRTDGRHSVRFTRLRVDSRVKHSLRGVSGHGVHHLALLRPETGDFHNIHTMQVFTIAGDLLLRSSGIAAALTRDVPTTLMLRTLCHSSSLASSTVPVAPTPALFARMSMT